MNILSLGALVLALLLGVMTTTVHAESAAVYVSQRIEEPIAYIGFKMPDGNAISHPSLAFPLRTASFKCQTAANGGPETIVSTAAQKLHVSIPDRASNGWDVSLAPTNGTAAGWSNPENPHALAINDATDNGCKPSGNVGGSFGGLMTVDPTELAANGTCSTGCGDLFDSPSIGAKTDFAQTSAATIYHSDLPHVGWEGTIEGVKLSQTLPAGTPAGSYSLPMTLTLTEL